MSHREVFKLRSDAIRLATDHPVSGVEDELKEVETVDASRQGFLRRPKMINPHLRQVLRENQLRKTF